MMYRYSFFLLIVCNSVLCDDCVTVDFEHGFGGNFTNSYGSCLGLPMWLMGEYSTSNMTSPHPKSTRFATLQPEMWTCMTSFIFTITGGGTLEINAYVTSEDESDILLWFYVKEFVDRENDRYVVQGGFYPKPENFVPGWQTQRITIPGSGSFKGYVMFHGLGSSKLVFLMDSFRYIAPLSDKDLCVIYKEENTTSTTDVPTVTVNYTESTITTTTELPFTTENNTELSTSTTTSTELPSTTTTESPFTTENNTELSTSTTTSTELPTTTAETTETPTTAATTDSPSSAPDRVSYELSLMLILIFTIKTQLNLENML